MGYFLDGAAFLGQLFAEAWCREVKIPFADGGMALTRLLHQLQQRAAEGDDFVERVLEKEPGAHAKEYGRSRMAV